METLSHHLPMEYEKCYVFQPEDGRATKRRRTEPQGLQASWKLRKQAYERAWTSQENRINAKVNTINATTVTNIATFLDEAAVDSPTERIPTGLILAGPNSALRNSIATHISAQDGESSIKRLLVPITSNVGSNVKSALKSIIQKATSRPVGDDDDELDEHSTRKGPKLLNYDLQILYDYVQERRIQQVVITIEDSEAFDSDLLSELIELLGCWQGRIPFACLFNVATSVEFLQQRLSKSAVRCLDGRLFDAELSTDEVEQVFEAITSPEAAVWLGPSLASGMLERQGDYIQSIDVLVDAAHYAYMCTYFANATSLFLDPSLSFKDVPKDHFEAIRNLDSFRSYANQLLGDGDTKRLRYLLDSDQSLYAFTQEAIRKGRLALADATAATEVVRAAQKALPNTSVTSKSKLYVQAMSTKLLGSPLVRSLLLSIRKASSDITLELMKTIASFEVHEDLRSQADEIASELEELIEAHGNTKQPLRSEDDVRNSTMRTTVVAQKVELSKQKSALSKQDTAYTAIVRRFSDLLESYLADKLVSPKQLVMHEIFMYDLRSPYREVFTPRPRHAIERALAAPHDYLDCDCCAPGQGEAEEATLAASQPATAVLYQLYLESGSLINASDLWQAFQAVVGDAQEDEQRTMALFQRALAELRYMGLVKGTRKRVDHVAKVAWKGL